MSFYKVYDETGRWSIYYGMISDFSRFQHTNIRNDVVLKTLRDHIFFTLEPNIISTEKFSPYFETFFKKINKRKNKYRVHKTVSY